jgi:SAM-dependent methyltransferase
MDERLRQVRDAYDRTVEDYLAGREWIDCLPDEFRNSERFKKLQAEMQGGASGSNAPATREFLAPFAGKKLLDAGCSANLFNYRIDQWGAEYYGVDISTALIGAMRRFAARVGIAVGALEVAEVRALPFAEGYFDMAMMIGVLEYVDLPYCAEALRELSRVLKTGARAVMDLPNLAHPLVETMFELETCLGRPNIPKARADFEELLLPLFLVEKTDDSGAMLRYFVKAI